MDYMNSPKESLVKTAKRGCLQCATRPVFKEQNMNVHKSAAQQAVKELASMYREEYDSLRNSDAEGNKIQNALAKRRFCLDLIDTCNGCRKDFDKINREINGLV